MRVLLPEIGHGRAADDAAVATGKFLDMGEYFPLARRMIGRFAPLNRRAGMLGDDDAVEFVAQAMMRGDEKFRDGGAMPPTYRGVCAKSAILKWIRACKVPRIRTVPFDPHEAMLRDRSPGPLEIAIDADEDDHRRDYCKKVMNILTDQQHRCITLHFWDGVEPPRIAEQLGISRQAVHQHIRNGLAAMKEKAGA